MIREEIIKLIIKVIKELQKEEILPDFEILEIHVEHPEEKAHGDWATNIALQIAKTAKKSPMEIAENLKSQISNLKSKVLEKIEVVKPGFINFFLSKEYLQGQIKEILKQKEKFGQLKIGKGQKVNLEFISANPTGQLHLGHGRGAFFGDTLANILEKAGFKTTREYYINDAVGGLQIRTISDTVTTVSRLPEVIFTPGELPYYSDYLKDKISIFKSSDKVISAIQEENKNFIENKLKIKFNNWVSEEKDLYQKNKVEKIQKWLDGKGLVYEKEGAKWLKTSEYGDIKDWVIVRETGEPTYLLSDIAYHKDKFDRGFDKIINIWGADHQGHVGKIKAAAKMLGFKGDLDILISQIVRLKGGLKLSKRKGEIITLENLIDEVGLDVARFLYLTKSLNTQMEFDLELAKEQSEKNPVYYVQYAHARICSILRKVKHPTSNIKHLTLLNHPSELALIKELIRFPEIIEDTSRDYQIQRLPQYAIDLATLFHQFYRDCRVISGDKNLTQARLALILATKIVLKDTLDLMGISAPKKM
ncbi:MAG: arginine--tRNA ligase [Candidatus Nealsonbacteria bacterium CG_4_9_14_0_2_um_filter_37_38]|uniref:Arginine--tRNA ligase n=1 Tax=Candidatus Nealsonbacteria bacterium CG_4_10_14_0_8_um_filter_37_14 TaxID=1974684 RepID=A0A2M7R5Y4_9BACT|nr:MAG: arginine--tRNA ligase [Candidatus Nealsonbacteria bacterium CG11_big_fil_rev_8_21_14_0_20_37_68]PIW92072.1 MAG: arginine--tRNA ligase [Candidatus Nealsonbacteria bacterium CG_4_8_14_3_um_filter_37_23]PIY88901.1 MAG: arginine--tRNA ligase [Candidatus Nealsonbacteria bacterium CG_4_10_14_0_8_um_filter_37_14]PJC51570.1 MAG: arginine--tRNA ligase [Candidatus Nealsonbacteria bacterium CG_4_9_14_0_2_um_filter_37_38]